MNRLLLYLLRSTLLFGLGVGLYYVFGLLQGCRSGIFTDKFSLHVLKTNSGIPLCCGFLAVFGGLLSPHICTQLQLMHPDETEWCSVIRCLVFFVGINHATTKIDFISNSQLLFTIASLALGVWWLFDRSLGGILIGSGTSLLGTASCQLLADRRVIYSTDPLLFSWLPCVFFSGGITISLVGRQLAKLDLTPEKLKSE
ncbi:unnamed protein product [Dibothriocephalus latus]|uniref:Insulin-induced gene 1 protein n=1 Tax=Dibothriocephalus latus TaxID=60516 RepID=A0A3P7L891_DIBLA|nr:unnamed protein product [Dibothriocephalus latus]